jgi:transposase
MRTPLPVITEDANTLKQRLRHEHHGRKQPRLQMRDLVASGQARSRQDVAELLGVHRKTIGHWLARYEAGGLTALLEVYVPAGKPVALPPDVRVGLEQVLRQPAGVASYEAVRQGVKQTDRVAVNYHTLYTIVRTRFKAKLKGPRPRHTTKPGGHS